MTDQPPPDNPGPDLSKFGTDTTSTEPRDIYAQLKRGLGHELVNDGNVFALIELAQRDGHQLLEQELREWQSPCGPADPPVPTTMAPTAGFNKENVKH